MKKIPMRTCVLCRQKKEKRALLRIVRTPDGSLEMDPTGKKNGRGAYICLSEECRDIIKQKKSLLRALETDATQQQIEALNEQIKIYTEAKTK